LELRRGVANEDAGAGACAKKEEENNNNNKQQITGRLQGGSRRAGVRLGFGREGVCGRGAMATSHYSCAVGGRIWHEDDGALRLDKGMGSLQPAVCPHQTREEIEAGRPAPMMRKKKRDAESAGLCQCLRSTYPTEMGPMGEGVGLWCPLRASWLLLGRIT
jgi:hypothetical protein